MSDERLADEVTNQTIVNEYRPGQEIAAHVDCVPCFGATILSLNLGSSCVVGYSPRTKGERVPLLVEPVSLLFMRGAARYAWRHGIPDMKNDIFEARAVTCDRKVSLTFRNVIMGA